MANANYKFLIIDDSEIDCLITSKLLNSRGVTDIHTVNSGTAGLAWIKDHIQNIGQGLIIVVDIMMPGMDGFQFMDALSTLGASLKKVRKVFMLSSTLDPRDIQRAENNEMIDELLSKPLSGPQLTTLVGAS